MLRRMVLATATASCLVQATSISAKALEPTGRWVVDYRSDQCLASRTYGAPDKPIIFGIRPAPNGESYLLLVARKRLGPQIPTEQSGIVDFGDRPIRSWVLEYRDKPTGLDVYQLRISAAEMNRGKTAPSIRLSPSDASGIELQLQLMPELIKSLDDCTADLERYWNLGGEKDGRIASPAKGDIRHLFSPGDYPADAYNRRQGGTSQFLLLIDATGKVAGCDVLIASGVPTLDSMACQVIRDRGKFTPALNPHGTPVRSTIVTPPIIWRMG